MGSRAGVEREVIINREAERRPDRAAMMSNVSAVPYASLWRPQRSGALSPIPRCGLSSIG
jgi:hypothetical protein